MIQSASTSAKVLLFIICCFIIFFSFYFLETAFFSWYVPAERMRKLVALFVLGSLGWMIGRGINHLLIQVGKRLQINLVLVELAINCSWLATMIFLFANLSPLLTDQNLLTVCSVILLAVELNMYPLVVRLRKSTAANNVVL